MKPLQPAIHDAPLGALEADLKALAAGIFRRWPTLIGFSVEDDDDSGEPLQVTVSMYPEPEQDERSVVLREIADALLELMEEAPGADSLLRARTFARTLH
jgi:hypothetical protein